MSKKPANSVLFIATLGVYIGLLMAGSAPAVVAQQAAAMTRNFELSDEIEKKDDLDLDPDCSENTDEKAIHLLNLKVLSSGIIDLVNDLDGLVKLGKIKWTDTFDYDFNRKVSWGGKVRTTTQVNSNYNYNNWTHLAVGDRIEDIVDLLCPWAGGCGLYNYDPDFETRASNSDIRIRLDGQQVLTVQVHLLQPDAEQAESLSAIFSETFRIGACSDIYSEPAHQITYRNTVSKPGNGKILVVTRLPRAALDELLAIEA